MTLREVPRASTYPGTASAWLRARFAALVRQVQRLGLPLHHAMALSRAILAMWVGETGWGVGESNFNSGSVHATGTVDAGPGWHGDYYLGTDSATVGGTRVPVRFRAYATADDAAADVVQLLSRGIYRRAWLDLVRGPAEVRRWYEAVMAAGYGVPNANNTNGFVSIWDTGIARRA